MAYTGLIKFANHAATTLASSVAVDALSFSVASGDGALFPSLSGSEYFYVTIEDASDSTSFEVVKVTARSSDSFTIVRAQDGTSAAAWDSGDLVQLRLPRKAITDLETQLSAYTDSSVSGLVSDTAYGSGWNGVTDVAPSKNAVYDKIETLTTGVISDDVYGAGWNGVTTIAPSKNAVYDKIEALAAVSISDTAYGVGWDGDTTAGPSKNAVYDKINAMISDTAYGVSWNAVTDVAPSKNAVYDEVELKAPKASPTFTGTLTAAAGVFSGTVEFTGNRIHLSNTTPPGTTTASLYNSGGNLYWNGVQLQTGGSSKWTDVGTGNIYRNSSVHIGGTSDPVAKLQVSGGIVAKGGESGHHVEAYGAVGDGSTDDAGAIGSAITAALAGTNGSNKVVFGAKTYKIASTITVPMNAAGVSKTIQIIGQGSHTDDDGVSTTSGTTILVASGQSGFYFSSAAALNSNESHGQFTVKGIKFQGDSGAATSAIIVGTTGYQIDSTTRHIIEDVYSYGFTTHLDILNTRQVSLKDCVFRGAEWGGETNATTPLALRIQAENGFFSGDITFFNCEFSTIGTSSAPTGASDTYYCAYIKPAGNATIAGLDFQNCYFYYGNKAAIQFIADAATTATVSDILISGCQFDGINISNNDVTCIRIENNAVSGGLAASHWRNFIITGNYIFNYRKGCYAATNTWSATSPGLSHLVFSNNYVYNAVHSALNTVSVYGITCHGNVLRHCGDSGNDQAGFDFYASDTISVIGNTHVADGYAANLTHLVKLSPAGSYWQNCTVIGNSAHVRSTGNIIDDEDTSTNKIIFGNRAYYRHAVTGAETVITGYSYVQGDLTVTGTLTGNGGATFWTSANDGAGSGLDADLLDGQHGSYYLALGNATGTLSGSSVSGGTFGAVNGSALTALNASNISSGTIGNAYVNWASPSAIGSGTPAAGSFTTLKATTASSGLKVGTTSTPSLGHIAVFASSEGSGVTVGWNYSGSTGETDFFNYGGGGNGGFRFYNIETPGASWSSTSPTQVFTIGYTGAIATAMTGSGISQGNWQLGQAKSGSEVVSGNYVEVCIDGVVRKLLIA